MQQQVQMRQISKSSLHHAANVLCSNALALFFFIFATVKRGATPPLPLPLCPSYLQLIARLLARRCACATLSCCCCCCCTSQKGRRPSLLAGQHTALGTKMQTVASKIVKRVLNQKERLPSAFHSFGGSYLFRSFLY